MESNAEFKDAAVPGKIEFITDPQEPTEEDASQEGTTAQEKADARSKEQRFGVSEPFVNIIFTNIKHRKAHHRYRLILQISNAYVQILTDISIQQNEVFIGAFDSKICQPHTGTYDVVSQTI
jgi:hypothetical protein